ncbi:hypothetical protein PSACC_02636 [Paramicrosporidium saccamoebae]|uniref:Uncharacterized protein n=1 Tax=Paramicrosporidium saccamoebae TaxID=1246581 RepID=A0A2H9TIC2_9FUNG|nr:hypothetical protein PSACC_02636 [Paramicrosporidium saccamoebae]
MIPPAAETPIELDDRELDSLERLEGKRKVPGGRSYGLQKIRYTGEAMQKYACRGDYDRYAQAVNERVHIRKDYRPYRPTDAAYRLHNAGFDMTPRLEEALVTNEHDLELEIENAELLCKKEEADVRSLQKNRRKDPFVHLILRPDRLQKRAAELTGSSEAMVTVQAAREFLRILIEWTRKVVQDVLVVEEQFRVGRPKAPVIGWNSVSVSLEMNGFSEEMIENVKRTTIGTKRSKLDDNADGKLSRITDSSEMREFLCEFGKTVADTLENFEDFEATEAEEEGKLNFSETLDKLEHELSENDDDSTTTDDEDEDGTTTDDKDEDGTTTDDKDDDGSLSFVEDDYSLPSFRTAMLKQGLFCCFGLSEVEGAAKREELFVTEMVPADDDSSGLSDGDSQSDDLFSTPIDQLTTVELDRQLSQLLNHAEQKIQSTSIISNSREGLC